MTESKYAGLAHQDLNALINMHDADGNMQLDADREAARRYMVDVVNANYRFFHDLHEKTDFLIEGNYWDEKVVLAYGFDNLKDLMKHAYAHKFRFETYMGALKFFTSYALKSNDGKNWLERFEDRIVLTAIFLSDGDLQLAYDLIDDMISGAFQPATPTFLNAGKKQRGEFSSCYLIRTEDNMESIARNITSALQLSKRGGGVGINLTNLREQGASIKGIEGASSGLIPVMKLLEDSFSYANQLGARQGAGVVYVHACHPDILSVLDTKRENADEKVRIKTLSLGIVVPDIMFELAKQGKDMYTFSPADVQRVYGVPFSDISVTEKYDEMVADKRIKKGKVNTRELFQEIGGLTMESGYPYLMFEDNANRQHNLDGRITQSNLCVTGEAELLTSNGPRTVGSLYESQEGFDVVVDNRARDFNLEDAQVSIEASTRVFKTATDQQIFKLTTNEGYELRATAYHKMYAVRDGEIVKIPLADLETGDKILVQPQTGVYGNDGRAALAYVAGAIAADGCIVKDARSAKVYLYGNKREVGQDLEGAIQVALSGREDLVNRQATLEPRFNEHASADRAELSSSVLAKVLAEVGMTADTKLKVPAFVKEGTRETVRQYLSGVYQMDGCITGSNKQGSVSIELGSVDRNFLVEIQRLLINLGVYSRIYNARAAGSHMLPNGNGGLDYYNTQESWTLRVTSRADATRLYGALVWRTPQRQTFADIATRWTKSPYSTHRYRATVLAIEPDGVEDVYDVTVESGHSVIFNGISTGQCVEIIQQQTPSTFNEDGTYADIGEDIVCNLGSTNVARAIDNGSHFGAMIEHSIRALTTVSDQVNLESVPSIKNGNSRRHAIGLGAMNLHGFLAANEIHYDSDEGRDLANAFFNAQAYYAYRASNQIAAERHETFYEFEKSKYADGSAFDKFIDSDWTEVKTERARDLLEQKGFYVPGRGDWQELADDIINNGLYSSYLLAVAPTGSISYVNHSTSSIHPIVAPIEARKEGRLGRVYNPAYGLRDDNMQYYRDAYEIGYEPLIEMYSIAQRWVDQGISSTLFFKGTATTRDINKAHILSWRKGLKTTYYIRVKSDALEGTESENCVACTV